MERYMVVLRSIHSMSPALKDRLQKGVYPVRLKKGEILQTAADHVDGLFFVEKGLLQLFRKKGKKKAIFRFTVEDQFIIAMSEVFSPEMRAEGFSIEAVEDAILWHFPAELLKELYRKHVIFNRHVQIILLTDHVLMEQAYGCSAGENNPDNYHKLRQHFPYLLQRVPIPNLANFTWMRESVFRHLHFSDSKLRR